MNQFTEVVMIVLGNIPKMYRTDFTLHETEQTLQISKTQFCSQEKPATHLASGSSTIVQFIVGPDGVNGTGWKAAVAGVFA